MPLLKSKIHVLNPVNNSKEVLKTFVIFPTSLGDDKKSPFKSSPKSSPLKSPPIVELTGEICSSVEEVEMKSTLYGHRIWMCRCTGKPLLTWKEAMVSEKTTLAAVHLACPSYFERTILDTVHQVSDTLESLVHKTWLKLFHEFSVHEPIRIKVNKPGKEDIQGFVADIDRCDSTSDDFNQLNGETCDKKKPNYQQPPKKNHRYTIKLISQNKVISGVPAAVIERSHRPPIKDTIRLLIRSYTIRRIPNQAVGPLIVCPEMVERHQIKDKDPDCQLDMNSFKTVSRLNEEKAYRKLRKKKTKALGKQGHKTVKTISVLSADDGSGGTSTSQVTVFDRDLCSIAKKLPKKSLIMQSLQQRKSKKVLKLLVPKLLPAALKERSTDSINKLVHFVTKYKSVLADPSNPAGSSGDPTRPCSPTGSSGDPTRPCSPTVVTEDSIPQVENIPVEMDVSAVSPSKSDTFPTCAAKPVSDSPSEQAPHAKLKSLLTTSPRVSESEGVPQGAESVSVVNGTHEEPSQLPSDTARSVQWTHLVIGQLIARCATFCTDADIDLLPESLRERVKRKKTSLAEKKKLRSMTPDQRKEHKEKLRVESLHIRRAKREAKSKREEDTDLTNDTPLPDPVPLSHLPPGLNTDQWTRLTGFTEMCHSLAGLLTTEEGDENVEQLARTERVAKALMTSSHTSEVVQLVAAVVRTMLQDHRINSRLEFGKPLSDFAVTRGTLSEMLRLILGPTLVRTLVSVPRGSKLVETKEGARVDQSMVTAEGQVSNVTNHLDGTSEKAVNNSAMEKKTTTEDIAMDGTNTGVEGAETEKSKTEASAENANEGDEEIEGSEEREEATMKVVVEVDEYAQEDADVVYSLRKRLQEVEFVYLSVDEKLQVLEALQRRLLDLSIINDFFEDRNRISCEMFKLRMDAIKEVKDLKKALPAFQNASPTHATDENSPEAALKAAEERMLALEREWRTVLTSTRQILRLPSLGLDRHHRRYWCFVTAPPGIYVEIPPGEATGTCEQTQDAQSQSDSSHLSGDWCVFNTEEQLDALVSSLHSEGIRESGLKSQLNKILSDVKKRIQEEPSLPVSQDDTTNSDRKCKTNEDTVLFDDIYKDLTDLCLSLQSSGLSSIAQLSLSTPLTLDTLSSSLLLLASSIDQSDLSVPNLGPQPPSAISDDSTATQTSPESIFMDKWKAEVNICSTISRLSFLQAVLESCIKWPKNQCFPKCPLCQRKLDLLPTASRSTITCAGECSKSFHFTCAKRRCRQRTQNNTEITEGEWKCDECDPPVFLNSTRDDFDPLSSGRQRKPNSRYSDAIMTDSLNQNGEDDTSSTYSFTPSMRPRGRGRGRGRGRPSLNSLHIPNGDDDNSSTYSLTPSSAKPRGRGRGRGKGSINTPPVFHTSDDIYVNDYDSDSDTEYDPRPHYKSRGRGRGRGRGKRPSLNPTSASKRPRLSQGSLPSTPDNLIDVEEHHGSEGKRRSKASTDKGVIIAKSLIDGLYKHRSAACFREPVDPNEVPDYYSVIEDPIDLLTIRRCLDQGRYGTGWVCLEEVVVEVKRLITNCEIYNGKESEITEQVKKLEHHFCSLLSRLAPDYIYEREPPW